MIESISINVETIYNPKTQQEYDYLMEKLERKGYIWLMSEKKPTQDNKQWTDLREKLCVILTDYLRIVGASIDSVVENNLQMMIEPVILSQTKQYTVTIPNGNNRFLTLKRTIKDINGRLVDLSEPLLSIQQNDKIEDFLFTEEEIKRLYPWAFEYAKPYGQIDKLFYVQFTNHEESYLNMNKESGELIVTHNEEDEYFQTQFTEEEIKAIDERYWQFAVEV